MVSFKDKMKVLRDRGFSLSNFTDKLMEYYGERLTVELDSPLEYAVLRGSELYASDSLKFINRVGNFLLEMGIRRGDVVAIYMENNIDMFLIMLAVFKIGAVVVPINYMLRWKEVEYVLRDSGADLLIFDRWVFHENIRDVDRLSFLRRLILAGPPEDFSPDVVILDEGLKGQSGYLSPAEVKPDDPAAIFYTSGTTGRPKGAIATGRSLISGQRMAGILMPVRKDDLGIFSLPFAHVMGTAVAILGSFAGVRGYHLKHFDARRVLEVITDRRVTVFVGVPAMYGMLLDELRRNGDRYDLSSMRLWASAADAMPEGYVEELRRFGALFRLGPLRVKPIFVEAYGMVELSGIATLKITLPLLGCGRGCVGWPVPPMKIRIVDEKGRKLPPGKEGEVVVSGPGVTRGYWNNPEKTRESFTEDGWFRTGDIGRKDRLGRVYFLDRKREVIKSAGYSVFPAEVESELLTHPAVLEAAVLGVSHPTKGEVPVAVVTLKEGASVTEEDLIRWAKEHIAPYKAPRRFKIIDRGEMPYGPTGKILKRVLKERYGDTFRF